MPPPLPSPWPVRSESRKPPLQPRPQTSHRLYGSAARTRPHRNRTRRTRSPLLVLTGILHTGPPPVFAHVLGRNGVTDAVGGNPLDEQVPRGDVEPRCGLGRAVARGAILRQALHGLGRSCILRVPGRPALCCGCHAPTPYGCVIN